MLVGLCLGAVALAAARWGAGPVPALVFAALLAPMIGACLGAAGPGVPKLWASFRMGLAALVILACWALVPGVDPVGVVLAWSGLMLLGSGLAALMHGRWSIDRRSLGAALFFLGALLSALPGGAGRLQGGAFDPATTAWLLDLSPATLMVESAGLDWLRHPAVYGPAGGDALGPDLRGPWGALAGGVLALVGYALTQLGWRLRRAPEHHVHP
ncbi:MAG TPA: hypothetical protein EYG26_03095 [Planctomycetes bacterium]|nr:hypothetical protein [Planctomycetota bacterium]